MKRSKLETYMDCLAAVAKGGKEITNIAGTASIGTVQAKIYLNIASQRKEVSKTAKSSVYVYSIDENGLRLLEDWKEYRKFSKELREFLGE
jgi:predicted transcriptional regulator